MGITVTRPRVSGVLPPHDTPGTEDRAQDARQDARQDAGPREFGHEHQAALYDAGPAFRPPAHHADMSIAEILRAIPDGSRPVRGQLQALRAGLACPDLADVTPKLRDKLEQFWRVHVLRASWGGEGGAPRGVTSPGRERVCELIRDRRTGRPISVSTYKRLRRWWEARGYLAIVRPGWTPDLSPGVLHGPERDHNLSQAYILCVPRRDAIRAMRRGRRPAHTENGPLSGFSKQDGSHARAREGNRKPQPERHKRPKGSPREAVLQVGALARVSDGWWAHLTRPFARWEAAAMLYAIDHYPDGRAHLGTAEEVRSPVAWLRWRLSHWLNPDGTARLSPAGEAAERARRHRERQALEHAELGIADRAAEIRAAYGTTADAEAPGRPWTAPTASRRDRPLTGWAARSGAPAARSAPVLPVPRWRPDPGWDAAVAAAAAAAEAEDAASALQGSVTHPDQAGQLLEVSRNTRRAERPAAGSVTAAARRPRRPGGHETSEED